MLDTLWQAWKGFSLDTAELSFPVQQIPYRRYSIISVMFFNRIIAKTKRAEIENEMSKTSLFSLPFFSCIYWDLNNN